MSEVQFEEEYQNNYKQSYQNKKSGGLIGFLIRKNVAKNERQANYILIGILIIVVLLTIWVIKANFGNKPLTDANGKEISVEELMRIPISEIIKNEND